MGEENREEDRADFVRLANKRVNNALKYLRLIGNLSNTSNYYYKDEDVEKIFKVLTDEIEECKKRFKKKQKTSFSLD
jgi:hypothetical protein